MPSYSPNETQCPLLGHLSPKSYEEFQSRERCRLTNINTSWFDQFQDESSDNEPSTEVLDNGSEENSYYSDTESDTECIFQFDKQDTDEATSAKKKTRSKYNKLPFWYAAEDSEHIAKIVKEYSREITEKDADDRTSCIRDCRRLPTFIGRVQRIPVFDKNSLDDFTTLDKIEIFRRDIRPCGSYTTWIMSRHVVTSWDNDGMPDNFIILSNKKQIKEWRSKIISKYPISFIYCLPVFQSKTAFQYSVEKEKHEVGYANQPFNYAPYLPKDLFAQSEDCELDVMPL